MTSNASPEVPNPYAAPAPASIEGSDGPATFVSRGVASVLVGRLLKSVWVLSAVTILVTIADYLLHEWRYSELARVGSVDHIPAAWLQLSEVFGWLQIAIVPRCWLALILATTATIIAWHARMFWNLRALSNTDMKFGVMLNLVWWFFPPPIGSVLVTFALLRLQRRSDPKTLDDWKTRERTGPWLIVTWMAASFLGLYLYGSVYMAIENLASADGRAVFSGLVVFPYFCLCACIALAAIRRIERLQQARFELIRERREHETA